MGTILKGNSRSWDKRLRINTGDDKPELNPKDPIQAAVMGCTIRAMHNKDFDTIANLQVVGDAFNVKGSDDNVKQVVGRETFTNLTNDKGKKVSTSDPEMVKVYCAQGFEIEGSEDRELMG